VSFLEYIALFATTLEAVKYRRKLEKLNIAAEAIPVPRELSNSCGIAIVFSLSQNPAPIVDQSVRKLYRKEEAHYILVLQNEESHN